MSKKAATVGVIACLGALAGTILLASQAKASPLGPVGPGVSVNDILVAQTVGELEIWYILIGQLYLTGEIDRETYEALYQAYVTRFYQLTGVNQ